VNLKDFVDRRVKRLLVVEDNELERGQILSQIDNGDVHTTAVATGAEALAALRDQSFDCVVLDLRLPDMSGTELLDKIHHELNLRQLPVIVYTGKDLAPAEEARLKELSQTIIPKDARSLDRLLQEVALFLHRVEADLPAPARQALQQAQKAEPRLAGRKVLIVDDDLRNIFALTSMLERWGVEVLRAENGREALQTLQTHPDIAIVLMDIMMPEMDGYETIRAIRRLDGSGSLPVVALTAKAMRGDRQKCLEAGASDYIAKPVSSDQLLSILRVWVCGPAEPIPVSMAAEESLV
jgi:CheY-like chemotaxis protein